MEPLKLDIPGPAWIIIPLSESEYDRWLWNDLIDIHWKGVKPTTDIELQEYVNLMCEVQKCIRKEDRVHPSAREEMRSYHQTLHERYFTKHR